MRPKIPATAANLIIGLLKKGLLPLAVDIS